MRLITLLAGVGLIVGSFVLAVPVAAGDPCVHDMTRPAVSEGNATVVKLDKCAFVPTVAHVPVGTEVLFLNADPVGHEVVGANLKWGHHDKILKNGDQLGVRFDSAGIYPYACMIHPGMTGAIIVGDATTAAAAGGGSSGAAPVADGGSPAQQAAAAPAPAPASSGSPGLLLPVLGLAVVALLALLGASVAMRRRRGSMARPTA
jgi:plastocyanin